jgi:hypothetical protein
MMSEDAVARDLEKIQARAFHIADWAEAILRRYHTLNLGDAGAEEPLLRALYTWLFVPPTLWPFNVLDVLSGYLEMIEAGQRLPPRLELVAALLPPVPNAAVCAAVAAHEHLVQSGAYEHLVNTPAKYRQNEDALRADLRWKEDWARLKATFRLRNFRDHKGIIRRRMGAERNLRPDFHVNVRRGKDVFAAAFDAFCLRWNLYGMQGDEPLLLKLAVNVTPYGTLIHIPAYWSFDPKRDICWEAIAKLHRLRVPGRQGATLVENRADDRKNARKLRELDRQAQRLSLKGEKKHAFLCAGLGWDVRSDPKRLRRLRTEFKV